VSYLAILFLVARFADRHRFNNNSWVRHPIIYTLALGVYCTSWTFYGLVGTAASQGWYYLPILLGPILLFIFGFPLLQRIASICRQQNIHSLADFLASRYGKRQSIATVVTLLVFIATVPYIALQLKAVTESVAVSLTGIAFASQDITFATAVSMIIFTHIFGANRLDVAHYHSGLMSAIAFESVIKIVAMITIAAFALFSALNFNLREIASPTANTVFYNLNFGVSFWVLTIVSAFSVLCLPRMFQVTFVECLGDTHLRYARIGFVIYLVLIAIAIFIIAWVGNLVYAGSGISSDTYVLALPLIYKNEVLIAIGVLGGFSAATAMIIIATLSLSQMLSNDVILPLLIRTHKTGNPPPVYSSTLKTIRRLSIILIIGLAWIYQDILGGNSALTDIGLVAFALVVQLTPAMLIGLFWQRSHAKGTLSGIGAGVAVWFYTLIIPLLVNVDLIPNNFILNGPLGIGWLKPDNFLGLSFSDAYTRSIVLSLMFNAGFHFITSQFSVAKLSDRIQAGAFINHNHHRPGNNTQKLIIDFDDLYALLKQFLGESSTQRLLTNKTNHNNPVNDELLEKAEQALAGVIGVASARAMLISLSRGDNLGIADVVNLFEETTRTLQFNQDMLFASFESISSAISVVDADLKMVAWNKRYEQMFNYPAGMLKPGIPVEDLVRFNAERGMLGPGSVEQHVQTRLGHLFASKPYRVVRHQNNGIIEIKGRPLPQGGYVTTYDDISEFIDAQQELEKANVSLEQRVHERTEEIEQINQNLRDEISKRRQTEAELIQAKAEAEYASAYKTQFLAIASHDLMQPLNAAKLYSCALLENKDTPDSQREILHHIQDSIDAADFIISSLLEISRLDSGALSVQKKVFPLRDILEPLANEYKVQQPEQVIFHWRSTRLWIESDPKYLRRILQNFLSNAFKYTEKGKVLMGCRRRQNFVEIGIYDTGSGISEVNQQRIFDDFYRIETHVDGIGLGLGIARRFAQLLDHPLKITSSLCHGSVFSICVPLREAQVLSTPPAAPPKAPGSEKALTVLCVDDDQHNAQALQELVKNWHCRIFCACSYEQVITYRTQNEAPDVLILDYHLNELYDGIELGQQLCEYWGDLPVCIVSSISDSHLRERLAATGFDFLRKPIKPNKLRALLERYRQKRHH